MRQLFVWSIIALFLFQCQEEEVLTDPSAANQINNSSKTLLTAANSFHVNINGNDTNDGSAQRPWRTLRYAVSQITPNKGLYIALSEGTFIENGRIEVPPGVSIVGAGVDKTILKAISTFYHYPASPGYALDKFLITLNEGSQLNGNQSLSEFTIDGDGKKLHGGIYVRNRNNVIIEDVKVRNTNFTGIWLWDIKNSQLINTQLIDCSWGSTSYCSGALNVGNLENVEIDRLNINESTGYGIKAIGPGGNNNIVKLNIHDSRVSVHPKGLWNAGQAPNIAIELWQVNLVNSQIQNTYVDNTISLINSNATSSTGIQTIRVHHNTIDLETRAKGAGYGIELTIHDAEVDHNYFIKGTNGIVNWDNPMKNWNIHHNTFYALQNIYPGEVVRSQRSGLHNVKLYNNTIEFTGTQTMNVIGLYGGASDNVDITNNLFINNNTGYSYYPNQLVHMENGAMLSGLKVKNNSFNKMEIGNKPGIYLNNRTTDPLIKKNGARPAVYYVLQTGSPLINAGVDVGYPYVGAAPDIGAFEFNSVSTPLPPVNISGTGTNTTSSSPVYLGLDSSDATLQGNMTAGKDLEAQNGNCFYVPAGRGRNNYIPPASTAIFKFVLPLSDDYIIWVRIKSPTSSNQASHIYDGKGKWFFWAAGINTEWTWVKIKEENADAIFPFVQGANEFKIGWADENVKIDHVIITNDITLVP